MAAAEASADHDRFQLGMTRYCIRDAIIAAFKRYERDEAAFWSSIQGHCGYDFIAAIKTLLLRKSLSTYSMAEVLYASSHPGAGLADVFVSHAQQECIENTLSALKKYAYTCWHEPRFWLDYVCLKQGAGQQDFTFLRVAFLLARIGRTLLVAEEKDACPLALTRSFCAFEEIATLRVGAGLQVVYVSSVRNFNAECKRIQQSRTHRHPALLQSVACFQTWLAGPVAVDVDFSNAQCRHEKSKQEIDDMFLKEYGGFAKPNAICQERMLSAAAAEARDALKRAIVADCTKLFIWGSLCMAIDTAFVGVPLGPVVFCFVVSVVIGNILAHVPATGRNDRATAGADAEELSDDSDGRVVRPLRKGKDKGKGQGKDKGQGKGKNMPVAVAPSAF
eukprot:TRINITY_DN45423_c0_g1_i2.p1 TRINITY_DN45423_c0_g1~~TRINITY_DN45423_c0_g1_i2.p1  ORF type:complete len:391 (-),score=37.82 TRINITY_DN45423_c0_g1_i2:241-1413(-)